MELFINRGTDYALRIFRELMDCGVHPTSAIAENQKIPQAFSYKIIKKLSNAGWIEIARGAAGGCVLKADLSDITLYDLMLCMDEQMYLTSCLEPDCRCAYREENGMCLIHKNLGAIQARLSAELKSHNLKMILTD